MLDIIREVLTIPTIITIDPEKDKKQISELNIAAVITAIATAILASATFSLWSSGFIFLAIPLTATVLGAITTHDLYRVSRKLSTLIKNDMSNTGSEEMTSDTALLAALVKFAKIRRNQVTDHRYRSIFFCLREFLRDIKPEISISFW